MLSDRVPESTVADELAPLRTVLTNPYVAASGVLVYGATLALLIAYLSLPDATWLGTVISSPVPVAACLAWSVMVVLRRRWLARRAHERIRR
jgi:hypothetical protein